MKYNNFRRRCVTIGEANIILELLESLEVQRIYVGLHESVEEAKMKVGDFNYSKYYILKECSSCIWIETKYKEPKYRATRYVCWLDGKVRPAISGMQCFNELQRHCFKAVKANKYECEELDKMVDEETGKYACSAGPIVGYNPKYEMQAITDAYEYDINSAYSSVMLEGMPNVNRPYMNAVIKPGQVGFLLDRECTMITKPGCFADFVFDIIQLDDRQKAYIQRLYEKKSKAKDELEKASAKLMLNASIGYYQRWNPFVRAYIVHKCNERIKGLIDDDTVLWNTDAIISRRKRPELDIGASIGQFKEERIGRLAYRGNNYQIDLELPKYRGVPKGWFEEDWDMLVDELPSRDNAYLYDLESNELKENERHHEKTDCGAETPQ